MTNSAVVELKYIRAEINAADTQLAADAVASRVAGMLGFEARRVPSGGPGAGTLRAFADLTGRPLVETLRGAMPELGRIDLASRDRWVGVGISTTWGAFDVEYPRTRMSASAPHQLLVLMFAVSLFMTALAFIILRNQVRPIRRLARAAEAFGKGQRVAFHVSGAIEVRQAAQAFLDMRARIERQIEQRTLMLSGVSHDLRTPLTRLKLGLSLAGDSEDIQALGRDVDDMEGMLNEFLAFARGDSLEETGLVDPFELAQHVVTDTERGNGDIVLVDPPGAVTWTKIAMRPNAVRRALENLVSNALRYGSKCRLSLVSSPDSIVFVIEDNGPGIPVAHRDRALRPFERLDVARNQNQNVGVGLGLAIATDIASSHGGALHLGDSVDLGGLKVDFILPK